MEDIHKKIKRFPLTVTEDWLNNVEKHCQEHETKHDFIIRAVYNEILRRKGEMNNGQENY